jgi:hypothetical protein
MRPNPPRLVTVALAVVLLVVGISLTIFPVDVLNQLLATLSSTIAETTGAAFTVTWDEQVGWICLLLANALLVVGSLVRGI